MNRLARPLASLLAVMLIGLLSPHAEVAEPAARRKARVAPAPDWVRSCDWQFPARAGTDSRSEGTRYLLYEDQQHPGRAERFVRVVSLMENESGVQDSGSLSFRFDSEFQELIVHRVQVHRDGTVLDRLDESKMRVIQPEPGLDDHLITGEQTAVIFVEDLRVGDALEYSYTTRGANPILSGHFATRFTVQSGVAVDRQRMRVVWSSERPLHLRQHAIDTPPTENPFGDGKEYVWDFEALAAIPEEDYQPPSYEPYPYVELSDFHDWSRVVEWALPLYELAPAPLPRELADLIARWQSAGTTDEERARVALQFVQDEVRYTALELGPESYRPAHPFETFQKRFGDCKGKAALFCLMLRAMNIEAHPALVHSSLREGIARRLPSPFAFNHLVVKMIVDGRTVWVDPTRSHQGGPLWKRFLPPLGKGLVIQPGGSALEEIPAPAVARQETLSSFGIKDYESPSTFSVATTYHDYFADDMRALLARSDLQELSQDYLNFYARYYPGIQAPAPLEVADDRWKTVLTVTEGYEVHDIWKPDASTKRWNAEFWPDSLIGMLTDPKTRLRKTPLQLAYPYRREQEVIVELPDRNWNIPPLEHKIEHAAFTFNYRRSAAGSTVRFHYECETTMGEVPAPGVAGYLAKRDEMEDLLGDTIYRSDDKTSSVAAKLNWLMVVLALFGLCVSGAASLWVWRVSGRPAVAGAADVASVDDFPSLMEEPAGPSGLRGWLVLVGLGLCAGPVLRIALILQNWEGYFSLDTWQAVAIPGGGQYHPLYAPLLIFELLGNTGMLALNLLVLGLFLARRRAFPGAFIALLSLNALFILADELVARQISAIAQPGDAASSRDLTRAVLGGVIWIGYTLKSRRVKATFVR